MQDLLGEGLRAGGLGFSSTDSAAHIDGEDKPVPSRHATREEFVALSSVCGLFPGTSLEFTPGPPGSLDPDWSDLMIAMSSSANRPLNWSIMFPEASNREVCEQNLACFDRSREREGRVIALAMMRMPSLPFRIRRLDSIAGLGSLMSLADEELEQVLSTSEGRHGFETTVMKAHPFLDKYKHFDRYRVIETFSEDTRRYEGRLVGEISAERGWSPLDTLCHVLVSDHLRTVLKFDQDPDTAEDWRAAVDVWRHRGALLGGSDAGAHVARLATFNYATKLLAEPVREHGLLELEEAVTLLTTKPAELLGLADRGRIGVGAKADLVVFDESVVGPEPVRLVDDLPGTASRLFAGAEGIGHVVVSGVEVVTDGTFTGARPGRVLRSGVDTRTPSMA
jgi:N-acyl-D-aspartate/D-glutamate deacylase